MKFSSTEFLRSSRHFFLDLGMSAPLFLVSSDNFRINRAIFGGSTPEINDIVRNQRSTGKSYFLSRNKYI